MTREERENALHCLRAMVDEEVCEECKLYGTTGTDHCEADCVRVAIEALKKEPKWIPVTEKRPVEFEKVLVTYRLHYDNSIHVGIGNIIMNNVNGRYHWNINEQDYIGWDMLAWMPLPEPYKAESED